MRHRLFSLLLYSLFWIFFFWFARLLFLVYHHGEATAFTLGLLAGTFTHGIKLDVSVTAYILVIPMLLMLPSLWIKGQWYRHFMRIYTWILLFVSAAIVIGDAELYSFWGFRMDHTPMLYLRTPGEVIASVTTGTVILTLIGIVFTGLVFGLLYNRLVDKFFILPYPAGYRFPFTILFAVLLASLIIPIRGGFGVAPINAGTVYFNDNLFVNHSAINVVWNVGSSLFKQNPTSNPYNFADKEDATSMSGLLTSDDGTPLIVLNNKRPNILILILESFGNSLIGPLGGDSLTTPCLNRLIGEGLVFTNFYASGNRTDKALPAILNGYPAQPAVSIIKEPRKTQSMNSIVKIMNGLNYHTAFWYGGDINFANFNSFLISSGFRQIITKDNFSPADYNSKWGVHDHVFFKKLQDSMLNIREPFFRVALTLSSHEPFEVPMEPVFSGKDDLTKFRNSVYYTDKAVGNFIEWAKERPWWENTLVILVADHCRRNPLTDLVYSEDIFKIPMLWLGGALDMTGRKIVKLGSQVDISLTLLHQLGLEGDFPFAKDLLSTGTKSFAFYTFNEGFAFITDSSSVIYDHKRKGPAVSSGSDPAYAEKLGKAYLQNLFDDYLSR